MSAFGKWATLGGVALVLAFSHCAVWEWRGAVDARDIAKAPAVITTHAQETPPQTVSGTVPANPHPVKVEKPIGTVSIPRESKTGDSLILVLREKINRLLDIIDTVTAENLALCQPDTLVVDSTQTIPPASFSVIHNPQSFSDRWWYWLQLAGQTRTDTTITRTVMENRPWDVRDLAVGAIIGGIVFSLLILWARWGG